MKLTEMTEEKMLNRLDELYRDAVNRHLDKCDFDMLDWLEDEEIEEYEELQEKLGEK